MKILNQISINHINIVYWYIGTSGGEMKDIH